MHCRLLIANDSAGIYIASQQGLEPYPPLPCLLLNQLLRAEVADVREGRLLTADERAYGLLTGDVLNLAS